MFNAQPTGTVISGGLCLLTTLCTVCETLNGVFVLMGLLTTLCAVCETLNGVFVLMGLLTTFVCCV